MLKNGNQLAVWTTQNGLVQQRSSLEALPTNWSPITGTGLNA